MNTPLTLLSNSVDSVPAGIKTNFSNGVPYSKANLPGLSAKKKVYRENIDGGFYSITANSRELELR